MNEDLLFSNSSELIRIPAEAVVFVIADGNYSAITMADGTEYVLTLQLGQIEQRIADRISIGDNRFIRIGKSLIINRDYITCINPSIKKLTLSDCRTFKYDVSASREALKSLKEIIEMEDSHG